MIYKKENFFIEKVLCFSAAYKLNEKEMNNKINNFFSMTTV